MDKLSGKNKKRGRCPVAGHQNCEMTLEIQSQPMARKTEYDNCINFELELMQEDEQDIDGERP